MAQQYDLFIDQGTTFTESISMNGINLTGATITSKIRRNYDSVDFVSFTVTPILLSNGQFTISLTATQTAALYPGRYVYDIIYSIGSSVSRLLEGLVVINPSVTY